MDDIKKFIDLYMALSGDEKKIIYDCITEKTGRLLISYTSEMSARAIDTKDIEWLMRAILLHILEGFRFDYRENFRVLVFVYFSAQYLKVDLAEEIRKLCVFATPEAKNKLEIFFTRKPELNDLTLYGFMAKKIEGMIKFVSISSGP